MPSFDIVSSVEMHEVSNAANQTKKEIGQRYDFKGSRSTLDLQGSEILITADNEYKLKAIIDVFQTKALRRGLSLKAFDYGEPGEAAGGLVRQTVSVRQGISKDKGREIGKFIKKLKLKVQSQIQEDQVRVSGKKVDDLQSVILALKEEDFDLDLQFVNMRN